MDKIKVLIKEPQKVARVEVIENSLKTTQSIVGGMIECPSFNDEVDMIVNEEGKCLDFAPNFCTRYDVIVGTAIFCGHDNEGNFTSLKNTDIEIIKNYLSFTSF